MAPINEHLVCAEAEAARVTHCLPMVASAPSTETAGRSRFVPGPGVARNLMLGSRAPRR
jgi:hypothetical protein